MLTNFQSENLKPSDHFGGPRCRWLNNIKMYAANPFINIRVASKWFRMSYHGQFFGEGHPQSTKCHGDLGDSQLLN